MIQSISRIVVVVTIMANAGAALSQGQDRVTILLHDGTVKHGVVLLANDSLVQLDMVHEHWSSDRPVNMADVSSLSISEIRHVWRRGSLDTASVTEGPPVLLFGLLGAAVGFTVTAIATWEVPEDGAYAVGTWESGKKAIVGALIGGALGAIIAGLNHIPSEGPSGHESFDLRSDEPDFPSRLSEVAVFQGSMVVTMDSYRKK